MQVPGYVDLQCDGAFGTDLATEPERLWELARLLPRAGVTSFLPTIVTSPPGITVFAGHTRATDLSGVDGVTHVFNAMTPLHHRDPGRPASRSHDRLWVSLIADGEHVDPAVVRIVERAAGDRLVLVSDSVAVPTLPLNGGRVLLDQAVRNLVAWTGCPVERALAAASTAPARAIGLPVAERDDFVVLSSDLRVARTITAGQVSFRQD